MSEEIEGRVSRRIAVTALARVEGEGALKLRVDDGEVSGVELNIYEPPRFFEAFLRGRAYTEPPDITARICGICPVAYQMSAVGAVEAACGAAVSDAVGRLRRLLYCGEWIESHTLHTYLLHAPDFLGYDGMADMARDHATVVERGLRIKKAGNAIVSAVGGREIHPVNVRVGGFYRAPSEPELASLAEELKRARDDAIESVRWAGGLDFPDFEHGHELVALSAPGEYAIERGRLSSSAGLDIDAAEFEDAVIEEHVAHSTALHARLRDRDDPYLTGPLARYSLNGDRLSDVARDAAADAGLGATCRNPFQSIVVRSVEVLYALDEALRLIEGYEQPDPPAVEVAPRADGGAAITEAPRGSLYHRYTLAGDGTITEARIVAPTSQNQRAIEADVRAFASSRLDLPHDELTLRCEQAIRNHDPCISCATHFLDLTVERS